MTIERIRPNGPISFVCDECPEYLDTEQEDFARAWAFARSQGWRSFKVGTEWAHACPPCVAEFADRGRDR